MDFRENTLQVFQHLIVPITQHPVAAFFQPFGSPVVVAPLIRVLAAINFDDKSRVRAKEIDDVGPNRRRPAETKAADLLAAQSMPQLCLSFRRLLPKLFCMSIRHRNILYGAASAARPPTPSLPLKGNYHLDIVGW